VQRREDSNDSVSPVESIRDCAALMGGLGLSPAVNAYINNLKLDPFERFIDARDYDKWAENRSWIIGQVGKGVARFVETFKEYPPSQESMQVQITGVANLINSQSMSR